MWAAALSRSGKRCIRVSRGRCPGRTRVREPPQPPGLACSPRLACLACPCICACCCSDGCGRIDRSGRVLHHTSPSRTAAARRPTAVLEGDVWCSTRPEASLLHLVVDRSNGCRTRGECWAAAGCVERTERVQLQRPPSICMLACEGADENSWQSRPRHTRASNKVLWSASLAVRLQRCLRSRPSQNACDSSLQI